MEAVKLETVPENDSTVPDAVKNEENEDFKRIRYPKFVYSWGLNNYGQLGRTRSTKPSVLPKVAPFLDDGILPLDVKKIVSGSGNTYVVTDSGLLYGNGLNNIRQLGNEDFIGHRFHRLDNLDEVEVEDVSALWDSCYVVTKSGIALGWGSNAYGQLGRDPSVTFSSGRPLEIYSSSFVRQIEAGQRHCVILTKKGRILTCGDNKNGQLGRSYEINDFSPKEIPNLTNVKQIAVGQHHNVALVKIKGELKIYSWGWNKFGQCGENPTTIYVIFVPIEIQLSMPITKGSIIKCGWRHSGLKMTSGELFLWGDNYFGQQGREKTVQMEPFPKRVKNLSTDEIVNDFGLGLGHTVALLKSGMVVAWGDNVDGSCGIGHVESPVLMPLKTCSGLKRISVRVFAGYKQTFAITI